MAVVLNITSVPQTFTAGTFDAAAVTLNTGRWRVTITPAESSAAYVGGTFRALLGQTHGGLWFNDNKLELYTTPNDDLAFSIALTFSADQPMAVLVDTQAGSRQVTVSGATTGNGEFTFATAGPYIEPTEDLGIGKLGSGNQFAYLGGISPIDNGATADSVEAASLVLSGGSVAERTASADDVDAASIVLTGGDVTEGLDVESDGVTPAAIAVAGQTVPDRMDRVDNVVVATLVISGGVVSEGVGGTVSLGPTALDFQLFGFANRDSIVTMDTPASGAVVLLCAGGNASDIGIAWTDNKNAAAPVTIGALVEYPDFPGYGTIVAITPFPMSGGDDHSFTRPVSLNDEDTTFALTALVAGGRPRVTETHGNVANAQGTTQQTSPSISVEGEALLVAYWWGSSPVFPPFENGVGAPFTAVPNNGFTVVRSYLVNNEFGEVQGAMAVLQVPPGGAGTYNVTWTHSPAQGAQLRMVAIEPALSTPLVPFSITLVGQNVADAVGIGDTVSPASITISGGDVLESDQVSDSVSPGTLTLTGQVVQDRITVADATLAAQVAISGGTVPDRVDRVSVIDPAQIALAGAATLDRVGRATVVQPALVALVGQDIGDHVETGASTSILPAEVLLIGAVTSDRYVRVDVVQSATIQIGGGQVGSQVVQGPSSEVFPIPPGRASAQLSGRIQVPSIESRESEQGHLFGVVRSAKDAQ